MTTKTPTNIFDRIPPYKIVQNSLGDDFIERLLTYAIAHETDFLPTKVGKPNQQRLDPEIRISRVLRNLAELRVELNERFSAVMASAVS